MAGGLDPLDWQTSSILWPTVMFQSGSIILTSMGFTARQQYVSNLSDVTGMAHLFYHHLQLRSMRTVLVTGTVRLVLLDSQVNGIIRCSRSNRGKVITFRIMALVGLNELLLNKESPFHHLTVGGGLPF